MGSRRKKRLPYEGRRNPCVVCQQPTITKPLRSSKDVLACLKPFRDQRQEFYVVLSIGSGGKLIRRRVVTIGLLTSSLVHPRETFAGPITDRAAEIIIAHNHNSGVAEPSREDIKTTNQLVAAGILLGIPVRDHIIITRTEHFSFREQGLIA